MIEKILTQLIVFPCRIQNRHTGKLVYYSDSPMFSQPKYGKTHDDFFRQISDEGWLRCPDGYGVYARAIPNNQDLLVLVHGLKIDGYSSAQGKIEGLSIKISAEKVEQHVGAFLEATKYINEKTFDTLVESIHEIRSVNAALYHASYQLQGLVQNTGLGESLSRNTTALSELISARINLIDALASDSTDLNFDHKEIAIYRKFDKLYKCFMALGKSQNVRIEFSGESTSMIIGSDYTDLIPLLLIDNAFKYSPDNKIIKISVRDKDDSVVCIVNSWGPKIEEDEFDLIFDRGYRGKNALDSGKNGSGIGLYFLKTLVESSEGKIRVEQGQNVHKIRNVPYCETSFIISFPIRRK